jgi:hypothetical protein
MRRVAMLYTGIQGCLGSRQSLNIALLRSSCGVCAPWAFGTGRSHSDHPGKMPTVSGSIRRECLHHMIVFGEAHLCRILGAHAAYYNELRTHRSRSKDALFYRAIQLIFGTHSCRLIR